MSIRVVEVNCAEKLGRECARASVRLGCFFVRLVGREYIDFRSHFCSNENWTADSVNWRGIFQSWNRNFVLVTTELRSIIDDTIITRRALVATQRCSRPPSRIRSHQVVNADAHAPRIHVYIRQSFRLCERNAGYDAVITIAPVDIFDIMLQASSRSAGNACRSSMGIARPCVEGVLTHFCVCFEARGTTSRVTTRRVNAAVANAHVGWRSFDSGEFVEVCGCAKIGLFLWAT